MCILHHVQQVPTLHSLKHLPVFLGENCECPGPRGCLACIDPQKVQTSELNTQNAEPVAVALSRSSTAPVLLHRKSTELTADTFTGNLARIQTKDFLLLLPFPYHVQEG